MSWEKPTGHKYLQNHRVLNHVANKIINPIRFSITNDFNTKTELSIKKGLNQLDIPVSRPKFNGSANMKATPQKIHLINTLLSKIYILIG
jgi:hypothetical protein